MDPIQRRSFLLAGVGTLTTIAGCSGGGDDPANGDTNGGGSGGDETTEPADTTTEQPASLSLENTHFCAESPSGYREYTEKPEATYDPGDVVWVYFEPSTVGTEAAGEGEIRFEYDVTWEVRDPENEVVGTKEDTIEKTVPEGADLSTVFLTVNFSPPMEFDGGTHTMELEVTDAIAGNTASKTIEFDVDSGLQYTAGEFGIGTFVFTKDEARGYQEYTEKPNAEYGPNDTVWYYYEIDGFAYEETSNALTHDLQIIETVTGPEGDIWSQVEIPLKDMFEPDTDLDTYHVADHLAPSEEWMAGEYTIRLEVTDGLAGEDVTELFRFTVGE